MKKLLLLTAFCVVPIATILITVKVVNLVLHTYQDPDQSYIDEMMEVNKKWVDKFILGDISLEEMEKGRGLDHKVVRKKYNKTIHQPNYILHHSE